MVYGFSQNQRFRACRLRRAVTWAMRLGFGAIKSVRRAAPLNRRHEST